MRQLNFVLLTLLSLAAGLLTFMYLGMLYISLPPTIARYLAVGFAATMLCAVTWYLRRPKRFTLRTLIFVVPIAVAILTFPFRHVVLNQEIATRMEEMGIIRYHLAPSGILQAQLGNLAEFVVGPGASHFFATNLTSVAINVGDMNNSRWAAIPTKHLSSVMVGKFDSGEFTERVVDWMNNLPKSCELNLHIDDISTNEAKCLGLLERSPKHIILNEVHLDEQAARALLTLSADTMTLDDVELTGSGWPTTSRPSSVTVLVVGKHAFSETELVDLVAAKNPSTLVIEQSAPALSPRALASLAKLSNLKRLYISGGWLKAQQLEELSTGEALKPMEITDANPSDVELESVRN